MTREMQKELEEKYFRECGDRAVAEEMARMDYDADQASSDYYPHYDEGSRRILVLAKRWSRATTQTKTRRIMNEDKILEMFFEKARWQYAIEKGLFKDMNKAVMYQLTTPEARLAMYQRIKSGNYKIMPPHTAKDSERQRRFPYGLRE